MTTAIFLTQVGHCNEIFEEQFPYAQALLSLPPPSLPLAVSASAAPLPPLPHRRELRLALSHDLLVDFCSTTREECVRMLQDRGVKEVRKLEIRQKAQRHLAPRLCPAEWAHGATY